ncbi:topoisomerase DNA-binding C4 zinc finger domain-containing protein [Paenibacillus thalictri]|uniref:DNA topoisomerase type IA zn finger domain-containing protein n=1 Tax=Paenibacillus thalictri TaxID=2527873 RepID=A0A4Q9DHJ1_9BACL|nr:hypothetical protein EYB31_34900 [Paenibacillus thalictri]
MIAILRCLVTTSDLTNLAKKEAKQFKIDYWHGALVEQKLRAWGKWQMSNKPCSIEKRAETAAKSKVAKIKQEIAATRTVTCKCGTKKLKRKSRQGDEFLGCSNYPRCRYTRAI